MGQTHPLFLCGVLATACGSPTPQPSPPDTHQVPPEPPPQPPTVDREALDRSLWERTEAATGEQAQREAWDDGARTRVLAILRWRHQQLIDHRRQLEAGSLEQAEGEQALLAVANAARAQILQTLGEERTEALSTALRASGIGGL